MGVFTPFLSYCYVHNIFLINEENFLLLTFIKCALTFYDTQLALSQVKLKLSYRFSLEFFIYFVSLLLYTNGDVFLQLKTFSHVSLAPLVLQVFLEQNLFNKLSFALNNSSINYTLTSLFVRTCMFQFQQYLSLFDMNKFYENNKHYIKQNANSFINNQKFSTKEVFGMILFLNFQKATEIKDFYRVKHKVFIDPVCQFRLYFHFTIFPSYKVQKQIF